MPTLFPPHDLNSFRKKLCALSTEEEEKLKDYLEFMAFYQSASDEKATLEALDKLKPCTDREFYKFMENKPEFEKFCRSANFPLKEKWTAYLKEKHYLGENISSLDGLVHHDLIDQYKGAFLFSEYKRLLEEEKGQDALFCLQLACERHLFQALDTQCQFYIGYIEETGVLGKVYNDLIEDFDHLGKVFWSIGYLHAAILLKNMGVYFDDAEEEGYGVLATTIFKKAMDYFFAAQTLIHKNLKEDDKIIQAIAGEAGLSVFGFDNPASAESAFLDDINTQLAPISEARQHGEEMVEKLLNVRSQLALG